MDAQNYCTKIIPQEDNCYFKTGVTKKKRRLFTFPVMQAFTCCNKFTACQYDDDDDDAPIFEMLLYFFHREKAAVLVSM